METTINIKHIPVSYVEKLNKMAAVLSEKRGEKVTRNDLLIEIISYEIDRHNLIRIEERFEDNTKQVGLVLSTLVDKIEEMNNTSTDLVSILLQKNTGNIS